MGTIKYNHFEYGEMLASKLKAIKHTKEDVHFFRATEQTRYEDLVDSMSSAHGTILIALNGAVSDFLWVDSDSLMERPQYSFCVLKNTVSDDTDTIFLAQSECKEIAMQIIARMLRDSDSYKNNGLNLINKNSFKIEGIGPVGDNFYGVELSFSFDQGTDFRIDTTMWEG